MSSGAFFSVIIPNWNGASYLPTCLDSLRGQTYENFEVIVVDNASSDESLSLIETNYPEVRVIELPTNRGLTGAANQGIEEARGEVIALLNNDTEAHPNWLAELSRGLASHAEAGMAASKMLLFIRREIINSAGDLYRADGIAGNRGVWEKDDGQYEREEYVFGPCGGAAAYQRAMLEEIGLFDEAFFMYCEDVDIAWRGQLAGYRCIYVPTAIVYHRLSATGGGKIASYYTGRNTVYVIVKNYPTSLLRRHWRDVLKAQLNASWEALRAFRGEAARARLRGQLAALWGFPTMLDKRRMVQRERKVPDEYLESILTPSV